MIVDDELDITFTFKMILEEDGINKQVDTYNEPLLGPEGVLPPLFGY